MTFEELDVALEELESRLERLRALYEQYFLGFEKIEPAVPRKDVDRRIYVLRREKIRNTGKRFKLQTLIQRYNTFQQYWQRVCREIENGTYRRHLLRAERLMNPDKQLTIATKRRFGKALALEQQAAAEANGAPVGARDFPTAPPPPNGPPSAPPSARPSPLAPPRPRSAPAEPRAARAPAGDRSFESLDLDMGFLGSWVPPALGSAPKVPGKLAPPPKPAAATKAAAPAQPASSPKAAAEPRTRSSPRAAPPPKPRSSPRAAPPPKPAQARPAAASPDAARAIADERVKELHQKLMELKRQNRETGQVSLEGLAKTLRETERKLRSEHKDRKIDFDVVIRDGKTIVKPTVR